MPKGRKKGEKYFCKKQSYDIDYIKRRFDKKFEKRNEDECWFWNCRLDSHGYGTFYMLGKIYKAHRVAFMFSKGNVEDDKLICHTCNNRNCVNPNHLYMGTHLDNMNDLKESGNLKGTNNPRFGKKWSIEQRKLISKQTKKAMNRPEIKDKFLKAIKNRKKKNDSNSKLATHS